MTDGPPEGVTMRENKCNCWYGADTYHEHAEWCAGWIVDPTVAPDTGVMGPVVTPEWVSVEDRLPPEHDIVIVDGGIARWRRGEWISETGPANGKPIRWPVTHWMPLPQVPAARSAPAVPTGVATTPQGETCAVCEGLGAYYIDDVFFDCSECRSGRSTTRDRE